MTPRVQGPTQAQSSDELRLWVSMNPESDCDVAISTDPLHTEHEWQWRPSLGMLHDENEVADQGEMYIDSY